MSNSNILSPALHATSTLNISRLSKAVGAVEPNFSKSLESAVKHIADFEPASEFETTSMQMEKSDVRPSLLLNSEEEAIRYRPNLKAFMDATNTTVKIASELLYGVIGENADLRNWKEIMFSDDPITAARIATRELYNSDKDYALHKNPMFGTANFNALLNSYKVSEEQSYTESKNLVSIETEFGQKETYVVSKDGIKLRNVSNSPSDTWYFGIET